MFIPPNKLTRSFESLKDEKRLVQLKSSHLLIGSEVASMIFGTDQNVNLIYYPKKSLLLIAPESDDLFTKLHKAKRHMLKDRSLKGDKTIALHELLIDHEIDGRDRTLNFEYEQELHVLSVKL